MSDGAAEYDRGDKRTSRWRPSKPRRLAYLAVHLASIATASGAGYQTLKFAHAGESVATAVWAWVGILCLILAFIALGGATGQYATGDLHD